MGMYSTETIMMKDQLTWSSQMEAIQSLSLQEDPEKLSYLEHHGIKGQKWGVRRYQNKDGSLTSAGRKRYGIKFESPYKKQLAKLKEKEKEMAVREEIQRRKNQLAEREAGLKDQGKSLKTLQNEADKEAAKWEKKLQKQEAKAQKQLEKKEAKLLAKEKKKAEKEAREEKEKARAIAEEEEAYQQKKAEKLTKAITTKKASEMTNEELEAFLKRYELEQRYKKIQNQNNKSVIKTVTDILSSSGQAAMKDVSKNVLTYWFESIAEGTVKGYKDSKDKGKKKNNSGGGGNP